MTSTVSNLLTVCLSAHHSGRDIYSQKKTYADANGGPCSLYILRLRLFFTIPCTVGPSGVRALPVAAGTNVVAIVLGIIFLLLSFFLSFSLRSLLFYQKEGS